MPYRSFRGFRKRNSRRNITRSVKYIIVQAPSSEAVGTIVVPIGKGVDNATLGQTSSVDIDIPTGCRIESMEIWMPKVNLAATANFVTWTIQHLQTGQAVQNPITPGGNPLRKNIILTGNVGLGEGQNNQLHVRFKIPKKFQRMGDGDNWQIVNNNTTAVSTFYYVIYKVLQ